MKQETIISQEIEGLMDIRKGIYKLLGIPSFLEENLSPIKKTIESQSSFIKEISKSLSILPELNNRIKALSSELDSIKHNVQEENLRVSKNYELAIRQFQYLNEQISIAFKKKHDLRYVFLDLLAMRAEDFDHRIYPILERYSIEGEEQESILNLAKEIKDFLRRQSPIITYQIVKDNPIQEASYADKIIYPHSGEEFIDSIHESKLDDDGKKINHVYQLGCTFPNYTQKAIVTLTN